MLRFTELRGTGVSLRACSGGELQMVSERERSSHPPTLQKSRYCLPSLLASLPPSLSLTHTAPQVCFPNNPNIIMPFRTQLLSDFILSWENGRFDYQGMEKISHWNELLFSHRYFKSIKLKGFHLFFHCAFLTGWCM